MTKETKNEWAVVCEKCGWEGLCHQLISNHLEDNCPQCHSNKIEWKGEDEEKGFEALYKELAYLEKQRAEKHREEINVLKDKEARAIQRIVEAHEECDQLEEALEDMRVKLEKANQNLLSKDLIIERLSAIIELWWQADFNCPIPTSILDEQKSRKMVSLKNEIKQIQDRINQRL